MHTPLWLNLKKEYIDDNFDSLLTYLKDYSLRKDKDAFYDTTVQLLRQRVQGLVDDCCARPIYEETEGDATFDIRLLAAYLLLNDEDPLALPAYLALMRRLLATQHKFALQVMKNVSGRLRAQRIAQHGYAWSDLIDYHADMFACARRKSLNNTAPPFSPPKACASRPSIPTTPSACSRRAPNRSASTCSPPSSPPLPSN
jgi:hypothetical protein